MQSGRLTILVVIAILGLAFFARHEGSASVTLVNESRHALSSVRIGLIDSGIEVGLLRDSEFRTISNKPYPERGTYSTYSTDSDAWKDTHHVSFGGPKTVIEVGSLAVGESREVKLPRVRAADIHLAFVGLAPVETTWGKEPNERLDGTRIIIGESDDVRFEHARR